jgi:hypothetical protein
MIIVILRNLQQVNLSKLSSLGLIVVGILLTGCMSMQSNLALYGEEQWSGVQAMQLSAEFVEMMEQGNTSSTQTTEGGGTFTTETSIDTEGLDEWLANAQNVSNSDDLNVSFDEVESADGSQSFILQARGQRYETMNQVFFNGEADISVEVVNGQRQVTIHYDFSESSGQTAEPQQELTPEEMAMQQQMLEAFGLSITFRITGGEIISSNATRVEGNTAIWETPTIIEVTLTEAAEFSPDSIALVEPPPGSGFSVQAFESMKSFTEELETSIESSSPSTDTAAPAVTEEVSPSTAIAGTPVESTEAELTSETTAPATEPGDAELESADTEVESDTMATTSEPSAGASAESVDAPAVESLALPTSGAVLPAQSSTALLIVAGLILIALVSAGAATTLTGRK